jgi:short-subunit dehydrogenase
VNISSLAGKLGPPYSGPYGATKAGLIALSQSLRAEYRHTGVSASVICPGFVEAGLYERMRALTRQAAPSLLGTSSPAAVGRAVVRAIRADVPEIIVNPGPIRLCLALAELCPPLAEWAASRMGAHRIFARTAELRRDRSMPPQLRDRHATFS